MAYPDFPRFTPHRFQGVPPRSGAELSRIMADPDAVFARLNGPARHYRIEDEADIRWLVLGLALVPWVAIVATMVL